MGRFSGKCDFEDCCDIHSKESDFFEKSNIYIGEIGPLKILKIEDAIPFFPYIISGASFSKESNTISLSKESWIDIEESQLISCYIDDIKKYLRKCKRNKKECLYSELIKGSYLSSSTAGINGIFFKVFTALSTKQELPPLHLASYQSRRLDWFEYAIKHNANLYHPSFKRVFEQIQESPYAFEEYICDDYSVFIDRLRMHPN